MAGRQHQSHSLSVSLVVASSASSPEEAAPSPTPPLPPSPSLKQHLCYVMFVSILCCLFLMLFALLGNYNNIISECCVPPSLFFPSTLLATPSPLQLNVSPSVVAFVSASWQLPRGSIEVLVAVVVVALLLLLLFLLLII